MTTTARVELFGPNLRDQSRGDFVAHAEGCRDATLLAKYEDHVIVEADSRQDVVDFLYGPDAGDFDGDYTPANAGIHFSPCLRDLP